MEDVSEALLAVEERKRQLEETFETIYARAELEKYASPQDVIKLRKMLELTIKGLLNEKVLEGALQPEMFYEEVLTYLELGRRILS